MDPNAKLEPGDLFTHAIQCTTGAVIAIQIWVYSVDNVTEVWTPVHKPSAVRHPKFPDLVLSYGVEDKHPKWIVQNTRRREKGGMFAIHVDT